MSKARDDYYRLKEEVDKYHEGFRGGIHEYVEELESENEQLKNSQSQKQKIKLHEKIEQLEADKAELIKAIQKFQDNVATSELMMLTCDTMSLLCNITRTKDKIRRTV